MFEAIRRKFVGAWREFRSRGFVSLFFFELIVVTLGVLLAQGVADWDNRQSQFAEMEEARARADLEMGDAAAVSQAWKRLGPCITQDIEIILRAAAAGQSVDPALLKPPTVFFNTVMPLSEQSKLLIRKRYGDDIAYNYHWMQRISSSFDTNVEEMEGLWGRMALLDPRLGAVDSDDRRSARETAITVRATLRSIDGTANEIVAMARRMELKPKIIGEKVRFARSCDEYREFGREFAS